MNSAQVRWFMVPIVALFMAISLWAVEKEVSTTATAGPANGGFEWFDNAATPTGWAVTSGALLPGGMVAVATDVNHSGKTSLVIHNTTQTTVTLSSEPMQLKVGHLYRLSGWIKTQGAITDPVARYPTPVPACLSMSSFPFEESSSAVGGTSDWRDVSALFFATRSADCVHVHLGRNGNCIGTAWFDDLRVDEVEDIREYIPLETVRWSGPGYRYDDHGWIFVHIEGDPYPRGRQYGELVAGEIVRYMKKLAIRQNEKDPNQGWNDIRLMTDAIFLRKFDAEYLEEMRGIADGAAKAGAMFNDRPLDLLDIVAINSAIDIGQLSSAVGVTATPLTGRNFFRADDEMAIPDDKNKCSSFVATHSATTNGRFVFAQMFMWNGYTGVNWEIFVDVVPTKGHRLLYETFPAGIHSGSDFYVNDAGIVIGETTTAQTPFNPDGTPQSNRIRKAAQYAASIDDVVGILTDKNNGLYTNDWTIADAKSDEVADLMLGTKKWKVWRTGTDTIPADTPGGLKDYIWANNNCRDPEVRKEFIPHPENAPFDLIFNPWNRDIQFVEFYRRYGEGKIDSTAAINLCATSPMNRPHACDAKVETAEMAEQLMVMAHYGKTTLREKMIGGRFIADLPGATPHLSLGYTTFSPIFVTEKLKALHQNSAADKKSDTKGTAPAKNVDLKGVEEFFSYPKSLLWANTVFPASDAEGWFVSGTAAYWRILRDLPDKPEKALDYMMEKLPDRRAHV